MRDDKVLGSTVRIDLTTHDSTGALVAPSSAFASDGSDFRIYKDGSASQKTTQNGITVTSPFDSITGKHLIEIDTSNSTGDSGFWAAGSEYRVEINSAKTISSIVQSGVVVGRFALVAAGVLRPTTDGRTLDVSAGGEAGIDWANVGSPTTTLALTGTTIATTQKVDVETIKTQALTAAAGITFGVYVGGTAAAAIASTALSTAQWTNTLATDLGTTNTTVATNLNATVSSRLASASYTAPPSAATISTQVASDLATAHGAGSWATATGFSTHSAADVWAVGTRTITGGSLTTSPPTAAVIADAVWDEARAGHSTSGTFGEKVNAALDSDATAALVDLIWDEPLTGATHNVATSSGKRLRQTTAFQQIDSTVIDASATTTTFVTGLTSSVDNFYNDSMLVFTDGALAGQVRAIYDYIGATKTIILAEALTSAPVNGVAFTIVSLHIHPVSQIQSGLATSAALATESGKITNIENASGYLLAVLAGACADPQTASETYAITVFGSTFTVDMAGQTSTGTRTAPTLTKA